MKKSVDVSHANSVANAMEQVFGGVNTSAKKRLSENDPNWEPSRLGKTRRDKANGHVPYVKNRRVWEGGSTGKGGKGGAPGRWVKAN